MMFILTISLSQECTEGSALSAAASDVSLSSLRHMMAMLCSKEQTIQMSIGPIKASCQKLTQHLSSHFFSRAGNTVMTISPASGISSFEYEYLRIDTVSLLCFDRYPTSNHQLTNICSISMVRAVNSVKKNIVIILIF